MLGWSWRQKSELVEEVERLRQEVYCRELEAEDHRRHAVQLEASLKETRAIAESSQADATKLYHRDDNLARRMDRIDKSLANMHNELLQKIAGAEARFSMVMNEMQRTTEVYRAEVDNEINAVDEALKDHLVGDHDYYTDDGFVVRADPDQEPACQCTSAARTSEITPEKLAEKLLTLEAHVEALVSFAQKECCITKPTDDETGVGSASVRAALEGLCDHLGVRLVGTAGKAPGIGLRSTN